MHIYVFGVLFGVVIGVIATLLVGLLMMKHEAPDGRSSIGSNVNCERDVMRELATEFICMAGLGPDGKGPAVEATVPPTAGEMLAQWLAEDEAFMKACYRWPSYTHQGASIVLKHNLRRYRAYLDANQQAQREERSPTS